MKKILENIIFLITQIIVLIIAVLWYLENYEREPLIAIVTFSSLIITTLFFRFRKKDDEETIKLHGNGNIVIQGSQSGDININATNSNDIQQQLQQLNDKQIAELKKLVHEHESKFSDNFKTLLRKKIK